MSNMTKKRATETAVRGDDTRDALITAAIGIFGRDGFDAASLREISKAANANQALIGYHFGSKEGLYLAVFETIINQIKSYVGPLAASVADVLAEPGTPKTKRHRRERYLPSLLRITDGVATLMAQERSGSWAQLILREQQQPSAAFQMIYEGFMGPTMGTMVKLVSALRPDLTDNESRVIVGTIVSQMLVFRFARAAMLKLVGWSEIGEGELEQIKQRIRDNVTAMLDVRE